MAETRKTAPKNDDEIDLRALLRNMRRRRHYFLLSAAACFLAAFTYLKLSDPIYEAGASVLIKDSKNKSGSIENILTGDLFGSARNVSTEIGILTSRSVLKEVIHELQLDVSCYEEKLLVSRPVYRNVPFRVSVLSLDPGLRDCNFLLNLSEQDGFELSVRSDGFRYRERHRFGDTLRTSLFGLVIDRNDSAYTQRAGDAYSFILHSDLELFRRFGKRLSAEPQNKDATIVELTYRDEVRDRAIDVLNALGRAYLNQDIKDKSSVAGLTLSFVDDQLQSISNSLTATEQELQRFKEEKGTVNLGEEARSYLERVTDIDAARAKAEIELRSLDRLLEYVTTNPNMDELAPSSMGLPDPLLVELITRLSQLQSKRRALKTGSSEQSPAIRSLEAQIEDAKTALAENIRSLRSTAALNLSMLREQLEGYENGIRKIPQIERELLGIQRNFTVNENIYLFLLQKKAETGIAKATAVSDNKVLDTAIADTEPVAPDRTTVIIIALLLSILLPTGWITLTTYGRSTVSGREDVERLTHAPVIGLVGHHSGKDRLAVATKPKSAIAEAFRSIRANLMFMGLSDRHRTIVITSSVGGEGKSFTSLNLATVLALQQHKVILIGMDLRKPQLFKEFGISNDEGISTLLIGQGNVEALIRSTSVPGLDVLPAGPVPPNPAELLARKEVKELIDGLRQRYDYILIDTPPVGIVSDAMALLGLADINVYVVRENYTRHEHLQKAEEIYRSGKVQNLCILINDSSGDIRSGYGYTGYGYYEDESRGNGWMKRLFGS
ncbi:MAG: hypothetical protein RL021_1123 [Bacteroidota bacterium]|jgi:capsular exopolysaccharide synthesis family protein